jgi:hypothetical protein
MVRVAVADPLGGTVTEDVLRPQLSPPILVGVTETLTGPENPLSEVSLIVVDVLVPCLTLKELGLAAIEKSPFADDTTKVTVVVWVSAGEKHWPVIVRV